MNKIQDLISDIIKVHEFHMENGYSYDLVKNYYEDLVCKYIYNNIGSFHFNKTKGLFAPYLYTPNWDKEDEALVVDFITTVEGATK